MLKNAKFDRKARPRLGSKTNITNKHTKPFEEHQLRPSLPYTGRTPDLKANQLDNLQLNLVNWTIFFNRLGLQFTLEMWLTSALLSLRM